MRRTEIRSIEIVYTNYRGETSTRTITPISLWYGCTKYHPQEQWFLHAYDHTKRARRDFALLDFKGAPK